MGNLNETGVVNPMSPQNVVMPAPDYLNKTVTTSQDQALLGKPVFPPTSDSGRLSDYEYFNNLLLGQHFEAFKIRVNSADYTQDYSKIRYVVANFAGMISKICADMLFSEPIAIKATDKGDQDWVDTFVEVNRMNEQLYENELTNSSLGDALFKLRVGYRRPGDKNKTIILEDITPSIFFPEIDGFNVRAEPNSLTLAWTFIKDKVKYLRKEIHTIGKIENRVYKMKDQYVVEEVSLDILGIEGLTGMGNIQDTGIDRYMLIHIPNWKTGNRYFGVSDYYDLDRLFYAINNRLSKIDNILDKHSDPILMIPDGVLDEEGKVKREALHMFEVPEGGGGKIKPEYIVWNANLEAAFTEIDKLMNVFMMTAEITPDILGMGQGMNDSGRALKFKLMRTIAKAQRKKLYYDRAIKELIYVAQLLAKEWDLGIGDDNYKLTGEPEHPEIKWQDGLPIDDYEEVTNEVAKIDAGIQSKVGAIMNIDDLDEEAAKEKLDEINEENPVQVPTMKIGATADQFDDQGNPITQNAQTANTSQTDKGSAPQVNTPTKPEVKTPSINKKPGK